ncbi:MULTISPECIES: nitrogenase molybdenum-iron protein alpha chain [Clostridium]|uniref:Nitrogenase protein alpha chain n=1 Tax=Clostridium acetobutylicum (strain ATCC 824 / DSM 792 / JCM 1419 / IAM 19013 / LMG 5710 / NBRC 13948 / NRRL B-527 / VKM B-1787 / 2291 / W) TaxID=272562 RepID=Q97ME2_CLOAB|nr:MULTISPECIES: nitrogenase molybdenum-iron protein alpha chain [Clostridium]AAK78237.1 Nitrogenase molybdenum-iron protein, alpha chain (nitrogenase component I) gene nifD [Clostridium acetobutylicum ATCC 824]ADZ19303.1 Nitrogenase molybdenum-iron protein, alpha chain (nitrogenase component I) gene nifD [Clostridium acetobutylicum EA 2018]AEI33565.1 nitrogenase molybdenum-iron protein, alpha chain, nitrogenase component I, nifD [Clostridium acetobutylicum DSM 1731]AWV82044.1 nitrogenase molyb
MKNIPEKIFEKYPAKTFKNRKQHMVIKTKDNLNPVIQANVRTIPGIITNRGCCYAGCKGVVMGPIKDMIHITHGPIGCSYYTWGVRRNKAKAEDGGQNFIEYVFSTDMQERDIVFGGEGKLRKAIKEAVEIFHPKAIGIYATCPVGLIGDDINAVARESTEKYGIQVIAFSCEGYKGVSQSAGHHIANNNILDTVIGTGDWKHKKYSVNILGEYNIGGDAWEIERILKKIGYTVVGRLSGDGSYERVKNADTADLNLVQCHRSINYIAEMMYTKYGIPWIKTNFIGVTSTIQTLRDMAKVFDDPYIYKKTEEVISEELSNIEGEMAYFKERLEGKTACLFVGGSRAHHYQMLLKDYGVKTVLAGYEFGHRDDYEGREVIPTIKADADSKNIPELHVEKDPKKYRIIIPEDRYEVLKQEIPLEYYGGMFKDMEEGAVAVDDLNHHETEQFIKLLKPDMFFSGVKDKYVIQKMGILSKQLHSYDYTGPYAGFKGAVVFGKELVAGAFTPAWNYAIPPWKKEPMLEGKVVGGEE